MKSKKIPHNNLILLFTYGLSLKIWDSLGLIDRELRYYDIMLAEGLAHINLLTYDKDDKHYQKNLASFVILPCTTNHKLLYSVLAPLIHRSSFKSAHIIKSNQSRGAWVGVIAKLVRPSTLFIVRCGWVRTEEMMKRDEHLSSLKILWSKFVEKLSFHFSDAIFVTTATDKKYIESTYRIPAGKIKIIPNSVDSELFTVASKKRSWAAPLKLISVGRCVEMKNFQNLILAVKGLKQVAEIIIIGDGPYKQILIDLAKQERVNVTFVSAIPNKDVAQYMQTADVFIMPQLYGSGMSKVMIEAMSCGLIVIGSNIQAHREVLIDGKNGFLCETDPSSIRNCLKRILKKSPHSLDTISRRAREDVIHKYSMRVNAKRELEIFASLQN